jgi:hypothetical protein
MLAVQTCPLWQEEDGSTCVGLTLREDHPPVIGWVNVAIIEFEGQPRLLLLTLAAE